MPSGFLGGGMGPRAMGHQGLPNPAPVAGAELLTNGNMETGDPPTGWSAGGSAVLASVADPRTGSAGSKSISVINGAADYGSAYQAYTAAAGTWLQLTSWHKRVTSAYVAVRIYDNTGILALVNITATEWTAALLTARVLQALNRNVSFNNSGAINLESRSDDISLVPLTLASLLSTRAYASADCDLSAAVSRTAGTQAGLCARLDSATSPANFLIAYLDGAGNVKVDKCVGGVYTNVISGAITYAAGYILRLVCSGTSVSAYYNGTQVGTTVTVSDAGIVSNTRHGKFSTYAANSINSYTIA